MDEIKDPEMIAKIKEFWSFCDKITRTQSRNSRSYIFADRARTIMNVFGARGTTDRMFRNEPESSKDYQTALKLLEGTPENAVYGKNRYLLQK